MKDLIVIGSGAMGLAAAFHASKKGKKVIVLEGQGTPGGMAAHFEFSNISLEKYYHFICSTDYDTFALLDELGISDKLIWKETTSGYYLNGKLFKWGNPLSLLIAPGLNIFEKLRYGIFAYIQTRRTKWGILENISATDWIKKWCGLSLYKKLWEPLFILKFHEYADNISAAWIWTRIKRIGVSRYSLFKEKLGHLDGGTQTLVDALIKYIQAHGGEIYLSNKVEKIECNDNKATVITATSTFEAKKIICTVPLQELPTIEPSFEQNLENKYKDIENIGVVCVVLNLKKKVSEHFWVNISMKGWNIPGIIEFSNLRDFQDNNIVYVPYYMPTTNHLWERSNDEFVEEAFNYIQEINQDINDCDLVSSYVGRLKNSQPICEPGFLQKIPDIQTPHSVLQIADTCFYYPEDRGISESVRIGREMAERISDG